MTNESNSKVEGLSGTKSAEEIYPEWPGSTVTQLQRENFNLKQQIKELESQLAQFKSPSVVEKPDFEKMLAKSAFKSHPLNTEKDVVSISDAEYLMDELWEKYVARKSQPL